MGDYVKAEPLYEEALRINQKALGPEHPNTAQSLHNLAFGRKSTSQQVLSTFHWRDFGFGR